jgi:hypothetical protein
MTIRRCRCDRRSSRLSAVSAVAPESARRLQSARTRRPNFNTNRRLVPAIRSIVQPADPLLLLRVRTYEDILAAQTEMWSAHVGTLEHPRRFRSCLLELDCMDFCPLPCDSGFPRSACIWRWRFYARHPSDDCSSGSAAHFPSVTAGMLLGVAAGVVATGTARGRGIRRFADAALDSLPGIRDDRRRQHRSRAASHASRSGDRHQS